MLRAASHAHVVWEALFYAAAASDLKVMKLKLEPSQQKGISYPFTTTRKVFKK